MRLAGLSLLFTLLFPGLLSAQWTNRYPKLDGYNHHVYVEGFELPTLVAGPHRPPRLRRTARTIAIAARGWIWLLDAGDRGGPAGDQRGAKSIQPSRPGTLTAAGSRSCVTTPKGSENLVPRHRRPVRRRSCSRMSPSCSIRRGRRTANGSTSAPRPKETWTSGNFRSRRANPPASPAGEVWRCGRNRSRTGGSPTCRRAGRLQDAVVVRGTDGTEVTLRAESIASQARPAAAREQCGPRRKLAGW